MNALQKNRTETIARSRGGGKGHATQSNGRHWPRRRTLIKSLCTFPHSGAIAQLGERIVRNDEVVGSSPTSSTKFSITSRHPLTQFCPKLVQDNFQRWVPGLASLQPRFDC